MLYLDNVDVGPTWLIEKVSYNLSMSFTQYREKVSSITSLSKNSIVLFIINTYIRNNVINYNNLKVGQPVKFERKLSK